MNVNELYTKPSWLLRLEFLEELIRPYKEGTARKLKHGKKEQEEILCIIENLLSLGDGFYKDLTVQNILYFVSGAEDQDEEETEKEKQEYENSQKKMLVQMAVIAAKKQLPRVLNLVLSGYPGVIRNMAPFLFTGLGMCSHINKNFLQTVRVLEKHYPKFQEWGDFVGRCAYFGSTKNVGLLFKYYSGYFNVRAIVFILRRHSHSEEHIKFLKQVYNKRKTSLMGASDALNIYEAARKHACPELYFYFSRIFQRDLIWPRVVSIDETWSLCSQCVHQNNFHPSDLDICNSNMDT